MTRYERSPQQLCAHLVRGGREQVSCPQRKFPPPPRCSKNNHGSGIHIRKNNKTQNTVGKETETYIQVYAPCNDSYSDDEKTISLMNYQMLKTRCSGRHGRYEWACRKSNVAVGRLPRTTQRPKFKSNYNGQLIMELCAQHGFYITNTFY